MGIALVPRQIRAIADQINAYYRVFKGTDPDTVILRLNAGGRFEIRHSATNAPVFTVVDAGASLVVGPEDIAPGAVTEPKLADGAVSNRVLLADAVTTDKVLNGTLVDADLNAAAGIAVTKLAHVGAGNVLRSTGTANVGGQVVNADVAAAAAIAVSKLAGGGAANRVVATADGTAVIMSQVSDAMVAAGIALSKLAPGASGVLKSNGTVITAGNTITSADITDGAIMNADINAAAGIDGAKMLDNSIPSTKLSGGATIPANSIDSTHIINNSIVDADINTAAAISLPKLVHVGAGNVLKSNGTANIGSKLADGDFAANTINGNKLLDTTVDYPKLMVGAAVNFASAQGSGGASTSSPTPGFMPDMGITLTTTGRPIMIQFNGTFSHSIAGATCAVHLFNNSVDQGIGRQVMAPGANYYFTMDFIVVIPPAAGGNTVAIYWSTQSGTLSAYSTWRIITAAEFRR